MIKSFYLSRNTFVLLGISTLMMCFGLIDDLFLILGKILFFGIWFVIIFETLLLFKAKNLLIISRKLPVKLSNGDLNKVEIEIQNLSSRGLLGKIIEELPVQLQIRKWELPFEILKHEKRVLEYSIKPTVRGVYEWGEMHIFIKFKSWSLVERKESFYLNTEVACYPSFEQFKKLHIKGIVNGVEKSEKLVRQIGQSLEFEQIKDYSSGDDYRHINWKASAKRANLMVNQYQDERSQDIYCVVDKGRTMKMPFYNQSLLDYSINACIALAKTIINMNDKAGMLAFGHDSCEYLPAHKDLKQFGKINELLYDLSSNFKESDFEKLYNFVRTNIRQRSLLVVFTNFDSINAMQRNLPYLKALSKHHLLLLMFFENSELASKVESQAKNVKEIYENTIAHNLLINNRLIAKELEKNGIKAFFTKPEQLSAQAINAYLDIKKKRQI